MRRPSPRRAAAFAGFLVLVAGFAAGVWWFAYAAALSQLQERGRADLALAADRLTAELQRFRELAVLLTDHPSLAAALAAPGSAETRAEASRILAAMADKTGSRAVRLAGPDGRVLAASADAPRGSVAASPAFFRAMTGALGAEHRLAPDGARVFIYAAPVFGPEGPVAGAVIVSTDAAALELDWPADPKTVFFTDEAGLVFVTNRSELVLTARRDPPPPGARAFPAFDARTFDGHDIWRLDAGRYLPARALHLAQALPVIGMTAEILLDLTPVLRIAWAQAGGAGALGLVLAAVVFVLSERRRALAERLALEAAANAELEARVAGRTRELSQLNAELRHEIGERREAEAALKRAQADLVQAGKLSALGQMSAGLSHELNQPLMAIRSFAENAEMLIARGKPEVAAGNLARISELARRMGRIIKNLRAFARQEAVPLGDVDLVAVVDAALEIAAPKVKQAGVTLDWRRPERPVTVRGGEVRLQQVVMNLVSNAVDAMAASAERRLEIWVETDGHRARLSLRDTGPGIAEPERIFDPFYSTKQVGGPEGMGLGLSISYGLVQSFGGAIRGRNHDQGGAVFCVELDLAGLERAA